MAYLSGVSESDSKAIYVAIANPPRIHNVIAVLEQFTAGMTDGKGCSETPSLIHLPVCHPYIYMYIIV